MTEILDGLASGLIWGAILGSSLIAIAAAITATAPTVQRAQKGARQ
jgi:hypothetical protein